MPCACSVNLNNNLLVAVPIFIFQVRKWWQSRQVACPRDTPQSLHVGRFCYPAIPVSFAVTLWNPDGSAWVNQTAEITWTDVLEETAAPLSEQGQRFSQLRVFVSLSQLCRPHRAGKDWKGQVLFLPAGWSLIIFSVVASPNRSVLTFSDSLHLGKGSDQRGFASCLFNETQCHILYKNTL